MKIFKITIKFFLILVSILFLSKIWLKKTASFRVDKIQPNSFFQNHFDVKLTDQNLDPIFNQNYKFLAKGRQSFVFVSNDEKYVIKFFRFHRYRLPFYSNFIKFFPIGNNYIKNLKKEIDDLYQQTMNSYKLVYENLKNETATIFVHLNQTENLNKKITITDNLKNRYILDLDNLGFVVQKKAKSFEITLKEAKDDKDKLLYLISSFFDNLNSIYRKNIINKDRHVVQNLGVIDDNLVVEIDIGRFSKKNNFNKEKVKKEAIHYTTYLKKWIYKNIPNASEIVDDNLNQLIKNNEIIDEEKIY